MSNKKNKFFLEKIIPKYVFDINRVIGIKGKERYILNFKNKVIRILREEIKGKALLCTYIPLEDVITFSFEVDKSMLEKVEDLNRFVQIKIYEQAGVSESEKYVFKYKIITALKDTRKVRIEVVVVSESYLKFAFKDIIDEVGYLDYLAFPAFSFKSLYKEKILTDEYNDLFVILLEDKIFLSLYQKGEMILFRIIPNGLNEVYKRLEELDIENFNKEIFIKLLKEKGLNESAYIGDEKIIYKELKKVFNSLFRNINEQIRQIFDTYHILVIDRMYITGEYGTINSIEEHAQNFLPISSVYNFEFYEKYNLDKLQIDPLLFLAMLETHYAYLSGNQKYNFSLYLRPPTFVYRVSGQLILSISAAVLLAGAYPLYQFAKAKYYNYTAEKNRTNILVPLKQKEAHLMQEQANLLKIQQKLQSNLFEIISQTKHIGSYIEEAFKIKTSFKPVSINLAILTKIFNKYQIKILDIQKEDNAIIFNLFSDNKDNFVKLFKALTQNKYNYSVNGVFYKKDLNKFNSLLKVKL